MVEFLRKSESRGDKSPRVLNSHHKIYQFSFDLYSVGFRCDVDIFTLTARAQSIY